MLRELVSVHASASSRHARGTQIELTQAEWASRLRQLIARLLDGDRRTAPKSVRGAFARSWDKPLLRESTPTSIWQAITAVALHLGVREADVLETRSNPRLLSDDAT